MSCVKEQNITKTTRSCGRHENSISKLTRWPPFGSLLQRQIIYLSIKMAKSYMFGGVLMYWESDANVIF